MSCDGPSKFDCISCSKDPNKNRNSLISNIRTCPCLHGFYDSIADHFSICFNCPQECGTCDESYKCLTCSKESNRELQSSGVCNCK